MKKAFTLSEVLIAMTIIGVIAAITVPRVMTNSKTKANVLKLKSAYTNITEAVRISTAKAGYDFADISNLNNADLSSHPYNAQDLLAAAFDAKVYTVTNANGANPGYTGAGKNLSYDNEVPELASNYSTSANITREGDIVFNGRNGALYTIWYKTNTGNDGDVPNGCTVDKPCILLIDINGKNNDPNEIITCTSGSDTIGNIPDSDTGTYVEPAACTVDDSAVADIYPFFIYNGEVKPATSATVAVLEK